MKEESGSIFVYAPRKKRCGWRYATVDSFLADYEQVRTANDSSAWHRRVNNVVKALTDSGLWPEILIEKLFRRLLRNKTYVVCLSSSYIRDAQVFDTCGLDMDEEAWQDLDMNSFEMEDRWGDTSVDAYVGIYKAGTEAEAREIAGSEEGYDPRCLYAIEVYKSYRHE